MASIIELLDLVLKPVYLHLSGGYKLRPVENDILNGMIAVLDEEARLSALHQLAALHHLRRYEGGMILDFVLQKSKCKPNAAWLNAHCLATAKYKLDDKIVTSKLMTSHGYIATLENTIRLNSYGKSVPADMVAERGGAKSRVADVINKSEHGSD